MRAFKRRPPRARVASGHRRTPGRRTWHGTGGLACSPPASCVHDSARCGFLVGAGRSAPVPGLRRALHGIHLRAYAVPLEPDGHRAEVWQPRLSDPAAFSLHSWRAGRSAAPQRRHGEVPLRGPHPLPARRGAAAARAFIPRRMRAYVATASGLHAALRAGSAGPAAPRGKCWEQRRGTEAKSGNSSR